MRVWDVLVVSPPMASQAQPKALFNLPSPVLCSAWSKAGLIFTGECQEGAVRALNVQTQQIQQQLGRHDSAVCGVAFDEAHNVVISASWDKTVKFWDSRQATPALTKTAPRKITAMDFRNNTLAIASADKTILLYNLNDINRAPQVLSSPLRMPAKFLSLAHDARAAIVGSAEARCCIFFLTTRPPAHDKSHFPFKACRVEVENNPGKVKYFRAYPVNAGCFHPTEKDIVVTAGGCGTYTCWDYAHRLKLNEIGNLPSPVTAINFDESGRLFAYACGYDWHQGCHHAESAKWPLSINIATTIREMVMKVP